MTAIEVILFFNILLALDLVSRRIHKYNKIGWKKIWESAWFYIRFWKPIRRWIWSKSPRIPNDIFNEHRKNSYEKVSTPENLEILNYHLPYFNFKSSWTEEELQIDKKREVLIKEIKKEDSNQLLFYFKKHHPLFYYLKIFKII